MSPEPLTPHEQRQFDLLSSSLNSDGDFSNRVGKTARMTPAGFIPGRYVISAAILFGMACALGAIVSIFNTGSDPLAMFRFGMLSFFSFAVVVNCPNAWLDDLKISRQVWKETRSLKKWTGDDWGEGRKTHTV